MCDRDSRVRHLNIGPFFPFAIFAALRYYFYVNAIEHLHKNKKRIDLHRTLEFNEFIVWLKKAVRKSLIAETGLIIIACNYV